MEIDQEFNFPTKVGRPSTRGLRVQRRGGRINRGRVGSYFTPPSSYMDIETANSPPHDTGLRNTPFNIFSQQKSTFNEGVEENHQKKFKKYNPFVSPNARTSSNVFMSTDDDTEDKQRHSEVLSAFNNKKPYYIPLRTKESNDTLYNKDSPIPLQREGVKPPSIINHRYNTIKEKTTPTNSTTNNLLKRGRGESKFYAAKNVQPLEEEEEDEEEEEEYQVYQQQKTHERQQQQQKQQQQKQQQQQQQQQQQKQQYQQQHQQQQQKQVKKPISSLQNKPLTTHPPEKKMSENTLYLPKLNPIINNRYTLTNIFRKFGKIIKVYCNPEKRSAIIEFENHESAERALEIRPYRDKKGNVYSLYPRWSFVKPERYSRGPVVTPPRKVVEKPTDDESYEDDELESVQVPPRPVKKNLLSIALKKEKLKSTPPLKQEKQQFHVMGLDTEPVKKDSIFSKYSQNDYKDENYHEEDIEDNQGKYEDNSDIGDNNEPFSENEEEENFIKEKNVTVISAKNNLENEEEESNDDSIEKSNDVNDTIPNEGYNPSIPHSVNTSKNSKPTGTCQTMCPIAEMEFRQKNKQLHFYEMIQGTEKNTIPETSSDLAVKIYVRPSTDVDHSDRNLRPLPVLLKTFDYLMNSIFNDKRRPFFEVNNFIRDRTRAIRHDLRVQDLEKNREGVILMERIARFHIASDQSLCYETQENYDVEMYIEQLSKILATLKKLCIITKIISNIPNIENYSLIH